MQFTAPSLGPYGAMVEQLQPILILLAAIFVVLSVFGVKRRRRRLPRPVKAEAHDNPGREQRRRFRVWTNYSHEEKQLYYANKINFRSAKLVNKEEYRILRILEQECAAKNDSIRVMAQTSMGAIIRTVSGRYSAEQEAKGYAAVNSKRFDFVAFNRWGDPIFVVEYQGSGHAQGSFEFRDRLKRIVLAKAGVPLLEILQEETDVQIKERIRQALLAASGSALLNQSPADIV